MSDKHFPPCTVIFREPASPYATDADKLVEILEYLRSIGEPNLGPTKKDRDFLCRQIACAKKLLAPATSAYSGALRCVQVVPPWEAFLDTKIRAHNLWTAPRYSSFNPWAVGKLLNQAALNNRTLAPQQVMDAIWLVKKDFCRTCRVIAHALRQQRFAKIYLESAERLHTRTMAHFFHLRLTLPEDIRNKIHWRS